MDSTLVLILIGCLTFAVALNLYLTFQLTRVVRQLPTGSDVPFSLPVGEIIPDFEGLRLLDRASISSKDQTEQPMVLVFFASGCDKCRSKFPELAQMQTALQHAGVLMWIISSESKWRVKKFLKGSGLLERVVIVDDETLRQFNPKNAFPYYIFIDGEKALQASGFIGDDNWLSFLKQMHEIKREAGL